MNDLQKQNRLTCLDLGIIEPEMEVDDMSFEEWKNIHLCDDDGQIIALCEEAFQAGERAGMCIRHEEYFSQEVNHHAKCPWCALELTEEMVAAMERLLLAAIKEMK